VLGRRDRTAPSTCQSMRSPPYTLGLNWATRYSSANSQRARYCPWTPSLLLSDSSCVLPLETTFAGSALSAPERALAVESRRAVVRLATVMTARIAVITASDASVGITGIRASMS